VRPRPLSGTTLDITQPMMLERSISEQEYAVVLQALVGRGIARSVRAMLAEHASTPGRVTTMRSLGRAAGISQRHTNRLYGQFAGRVRRELGLAYPGVELAAIASWPAPPIDAAEEFSFRMRAAFARALARTGLATRPARRPPSRPVPPREPMVDDLYEGTISRSQVVGWERNREARRICIEYFGLVCQACGFSFERRYGELGKAFIEVHHTTQFASDHGRRKVDPLVDLVPVCSNCHRMLHRHTPPLGLRALRKICGRNV
jgi:hypothetical protein